MPESTFKSNFTSEGHKFNMDKKYQNWLSMECKPGITLKIYLQCVCIGIVVYQSNTYSLYVLYTVFLCIEEHCRSNLLSKKARKCLQPRLEPKVFDEQFNHQTTILPTQRKTMKSNQSDDCIYKSTSFPGSLGPRVR